MADAQSPSQPAPQGQIIDINFKGVVERGSYESGDYVFQIKNAVAHPGPSGVYILLTLQFMEGKYAGLFNEEMVSLAQKALWRAKSFFKAVGYEVPDGPIRVNTADLLDLVFKCHAEKEVDPTGKYPPKLKITQYWSKDEVIPATLAPETAATLAPPDGAPAPDGAASAAAPAAPAAPVARPKVKV
jgi:hypothetical protein